ncbi:MAG: hypothetical protein KatS3mg009_0947 [Acidimicrobiia bacterium]|nr:MAG: hypothetical protein KatS3mg009_0947 [Acidimicrobiia bacterium]
MIVAGADRDEGAAAALAAAGAGAHVVLVGEDVARLGALAARLAGVRVAVHAGAVDDPALAEMIDELFGR